MEEDTTTVPDTLHQDGGDLNAEELAEQLEELRQEKERLEQEAQKAKELAENYKRRAEKAEKHKPVASEKLDTNVIEETVLKTQGYTSEQLEFLKKVSSVENVSLIEATNNPIYASWKDAQKAKESEDNASLSASRRSGFKKPEATFQTAKTAEDHKALWRKSLGR